MDQYPGAGNFQRLVPRNPHRVDVHPLLYLRLSPPGGLGGTILGIWLFPIIVILPLFTVLSRIIYKATKNPYVAGISMAIIVTVMSCTNTLTAI